MADEVQYEFRSVKAVRGMESRTISKWQTAGWELVDQNTSTLHSTLNLRRPKPPLPWRMIALVGAVVLILASIIGVGVFLEGNSTERKEPSAKPTATPAAREKPRERVKTGTETTLTLANNRELAALLVVSDYCDESVARFAQKYDGRRIKFDASIAHMMNHGDYKTRYDILLAPGDKGPEEPFGPAFKFEDINIVSDLHLTGENVPDHLGEGDLLRVVAEVEDYNPTQCLFFLEPVKTEVR